MSEVYFKKIAFVILRMPDDTIADVPLYIKLQDKNSVDNMQKELIQRVTKAVRERYENEITEQITKLKQGVNENERIHN